MDANATTQIQRCPPHGSREAEFELYRRCEFLHTDWNIQVLTSQMLPPAARIHSPADTIPVRHLHQSIGKSKKPITVVRWTPEGRRLLTGGHTGEFMLWNGTAFNFETVMDVSVRDF